MIRRLLCAKTYKRLLTGLRMNLRIACQSSLRDRVTVTDTDARVERNGRYVPCTITVRPAASSETDAMLVVLLQDRAPEPALHSSDESSSEDVESTTAKSLPALLLENEVKSIREEFQNSTEAMEIPNDQLQWTNEELESSKEELQSLNEELCSVNDELLEKVGELDSANTELKDLMASTEIATLFLDKHLRIKRFTQPTVNIFNLLPSDEGRLLSDFASRIVDSRMLDECKQVLDQQTVLETEIYTDDLRCYLRRILPFRTSDHRTDGIVITFLDLTERKLAETSLRDIQERTQAIVNTASEAIISIKHSGIIDSVNHATESMSGYTSAELVGQNICILMSLPLPRGYEGYIQGILDTAEARYVGVGREVVCKRKDGSTFPADLAVSQVHDLGLFSCPIVHAECCRCRHFEEADLVPKRDSVATHTQHRLATSTAVTCLLQHFQ
jgi:two-component system CheB/CheR fusion protein